MKVALFSDTYPPQINGVATATATLAEALRQHGDDVLVVTVALDKQRKMTYQDGIIRMPGITVKRLYNYKFAGFYSSRAEKLIVAFHPDVIHVQTEVGIGIFGRILARKYSIPLIYTYHTMYEDYTYYVTGGLKPIDSAAKKAVAFVSTMIGDSTTEFVTTSEKTELALKRYGVKKFINVVPNGIDLTPLSPEKNDPKEVEALRQQYGLGGRKVLLILGRLAKEKANDLVMKYYADFKKSHPDINLALLIVGDGPAKEGLEKLSEELGLQKDVVFTGAVKHEKVPLYYALGDVYVSASVSETQGLTYIEAMAAKKPVMARFDLNLKETIIDGVTGFFFKDSESFGEKLFLLLSMEEETKDKLIKQAYENDVKKFGLGLFFERIHQVYEKAIRKFW